MKKIGRPEPRKRSEKKLSPGLKGTVQLYFNDILLGAINADNGRRYPFKRAQWMSDTEPNIGLRVAFELDGSQAVRVRILQIRNRKTEDRKTG